MRQMYMLILLRLIHRERPEVCSSSLSRTLLSLHLMHLSLIKTVSHRAIRLKSNPALSSTGVMLSSE